ncbi:cytosine-specific methyltransferase [Oceanobacillus iheyensis HTE831]|uniref:Putative type II methyltransferase M.OihORF3336P n=1 Tax=Oceanobacillus iheyensis (strain DSM 14371 / CIP 107618 / JCM 11309 / KCTC 3954 / HTE831) TaxID=221109 RepID=MT36_OCEIH|nr:DNA (cytosine-5-)-methyltransferase [Oceanobacillus iheyensis]Q8EL95.1 RecName: Full=Putative type II methyltransferase M.OihORF3336P; Short=M.OihORF3336P; AltName: Full=Cytosine-specific methyltransferase; AltName: Full=Putative modification methylase OB3336 [Oceanobacillus iheyensis HTE831]BAC15292.1 cytosine-specific methyltransferase [Oceanobacillus iheyensis HTE831]
MHQIYSATSTDKKLPEVVDLFSGCGGLALGFQLAGFNIRKGIELDRDASDVASFNLHWRQGKHDRHLNNDITLLSANEFYNDLDRKNDLIVIGGPPCQAYSKIGRAKLKSLGEERRQENDARGKLYENFLDYALHVDANVIVMENVPEAVNYGGVNIPDTVCDILINKGYDAIWTVLNAADFGVPQTRVRLFVMAIKKDIGKIKFIPEPTHKPHINVKRQSVNVRWMQSEIRNSKYYKQPNIPDETLSDWVTVGDAIGDLPNLFPVYNQKYKNYKPMMMKEYKSPPQNTFQKLMRINNKVDKVTGNMFRNTKRDFSIFDKMEEGDNYLDAHNIAMSLLRKEMRKSGITKENEFEYRLLKDRIVPPYSTEKFVEKWRKLSSDKPSHTLVAHLSTDTYSHLHPREPRGISVREAARLQSFPDDFLFDCSMGAAFKQIGNAVPPLLAKAIAEAMKKNIQGGCI